MSNHTLGLRTPFIGFVTDRVISDAVLGSIASIPGVRWKDSGTFRRDYILAKLEDVRIGA